MRTDPRGGHNRMFINKDFFKKWTPSMAYVVGLISADGAVEDVRKSSRTCYFTLVSKDYSLIRQVRHALASKHKIYKRKEKLQKFSNGTFHCSENYALRVGSKEMCQDLINLGVIPRKSLRLKLPRVSDKLLEHFMRGYFDGDGCICVTLPKGRSKLRLDIIFTSGCNRFLSEVGKRLSKTLPIPEVKVYFNSGAYRLKYNKKESLKILSYMYRDANLYLDRKYKIYQDYIKGTQSVRKSTSGL